MPWTLASIGILALFSSIGGLVVWTLKTKRRIDNDPEYLYVILYTKANPLKKRLLLSLLILWYSRLQDTLDLDTANVLRMYLSCPRRTDTSGYSLKDWESVLGAREELVSSNLGSNIIQLCLILQAAGEQQTLMQIATFGLDVEELTGGDVIVRAQRYQSRLSSQVVDSIRSELIALGKVSQIIREYIAQVVENTAFGQLEKAMNLIKGIKLERDSNSYEEITIQQIAENWRNIGRVEIARIPYIAGRPITETELFFGRKRELAQIMQSLKSSHVAVWGKRRIGKTSILHQLKGHLMRQPESQYRFIPVFLNVEPLSGEELNRLLVETTRRSLAEQFSFETLPLIYERKPLHEYTASDSERDLKEIIAQLQQELAGFQIRLVWLIDEADKLLGQSPTIQTQLKALACSQLLSPNLVLVLVGMNHPLGLSQNGVDAFYSSFHSVQLTSLLPDEAWNLVVEPVQGAFSYDEDAVEKIVQESNYEPYWIQLLCREALGIALYQERTIVTLKDVERAIVICRTTRQLLEAKSRSWAML